MSQSLPPSDMPTQPPTTDILRDLQERVATLEQAGIDVDNDFAKADNHLNQIEQRLKDLEARLEQLQPSYRRCRKCNRALRSVSGKCTICGEVN